MILFEILFGILSIFLIPGLLIWLVFYFLNKGEPSPSATTGREPRYTGGGSSIGTSSSSGSASRDEQWRRYLISFKNGQLNSTELRLLDRILESDQAPDSFAAEALADVPRPPKAAMAGASGTELAALEVTGGAARPESAPAPAPGILKQDLDGTSLLLYFGAFLFVTAAGLFVAFGGFSGGIRTFVVAATMAVMYGGGLWLYDRSRRLMPAGVAFVAIGMAIAPLVGVTAYYYLAAGRHAPLIWLATSLLCLLMYAYALMRLRYTFVSYLFIFSFVSLFESAVAIIEGPVQYYLWMLIIVGMLLKVFGFFKENEELRGPAALSAQVIVPLSLFVSLILLQKEGLMQLGVSLLLAAVYYTLEAVQSKVEKVREPLAIAAQVLYVLGFSVLTYAVAEDMLAVALALMGLAVIQSATIALLTVRNVITENFASIAFISALPAAVLAYPYGVAMVMGVGAVIVIGAVTTWYQRRPDAYIGTALAFVALPFVIGQFAVGSRPVTAEVQTALAFVPLLILWCVRLWLVSRRQTGERWLIAAVSVYIIAGVAALVPAIYAGGWLGIIASLAFAMTLAVVARIDKDHNWWAAAGAVVSLPIAREIVMPNEMVFSAAVLIAAVINLGLTLISRAEFNRWLVAIVGLLVPVALGAGGFGYTWSAVGYAYAYLAIMIGLIICRSIARGVYLASSNVPVMSFYRSASLSYVAGYIAAAGLAVLISLGSDASSLHTSVILAVLLVVTPYLALSVEKNKQILSFMPWLSLGLLISLFRPDIATPTANVVILGASLLAVVWYAWTEQNREYMGLAYEDVRSSTLALAFIPILLGIWYQESDVALPITLAIAGLLTLHRSWDRAQSDREASGGIIVLALMWALYTLGVHNIQAHTHILAATFAAYAYWRLRRGDRANSDQYLYAMLATATIPLILQALGGTAGDAYGWWLLLEQIGFMILGISIQRHFVTMWGLYVAIAAVLYQLRHLGWAALSFLALFIIGMAIYRLLRTTDKR